MGHRVGITLPPDTWLVADLKAPPRKGYPDLLGVDGALTQPTCHLRERQRLILIYLTKFVGAGH